MTPVLGGIIKSLKTTATALTGVENTAVPAFNSAKTGMEAVINRSKELNTATTTAFTNTKVKVDAAKSAVKDFGNASKESFDKVESSSEQTAKSVGRLKNPLIAIGAAIYTITAAVKGLSSAAKAIDEYSSTKARIDLMNDGLQTTEALQKMIFASAARTRSEYSSTAASVAKLGLLAGDAFSSNQEIIAFTELMNKSFKIGGSGAQEQAAAMYQLTQALASGKLQGDEFRAIMENAPMLAQAIADFAGKSKGELKKMSAEGLITADMIKNAMFHSADEINATFQKLPKRFSDVWIEIKNRALQTFQPFIERVTAFMKSDQFSELSQNIINGVVKIGNGIIKLAEITASVVAFIVKHWDAVKLVLYTISAIIGGVFIFNIWKAAAAMKEAGTIFGMAFKTFGIITIIAAIAALILWIIDLYNTNEAFRIKVQEVWAEYKWAIITVLSAIALIFAAVYLPTMTAAITKTAILMWTTIKAGAAMVITWIKVGMAFLAAHWWLLLIVAAVAFAIYAWNNLGEAGKVLAVLIGVVVIAIIAWTAAQWALNVAMAANPVGAIIMAIVILITVIALVIMWIVNLWKKNMDFKYGIIKIWNGILGFFDQIPIFFQMVGYGIANAFDWAKLQVIKTMNGMGNAVIKIINGLINILNKIPGVAITPLQELKGAAELEAQHEAEKQARAEKLAASKEAAAAKAAARDAKMAEDRANDEKEIARKAAEKEAEKNARMGAGVEGDYEKYAGDPNGEIDWSKYGGAGATTIDGGDLDSVGRINDDVSITDEDIKLLKDVAKMEFINKYTTLRPEMTVTFGDVRETADVNKILDALEEMVEEAYASVLVGG